MGENNILTAFKKYGAVVLAISILVLLTGCGDFSPVDESSTGLFTEYIVYPFSLLIKAIARVFNGSYGLSIILITIGIRLIILPFMVKQQKQSKLSQEKMKVIKPEMDEIQKKYQDKRDMDDQLAMQRELNELYQKHNFNPVKMMSGCLPMIIQMPFLIGFYYAIRRTSEIGEQPFLWFNLGETDLILVGLAVAVYFLQALVSLVGLEQKQQGAMGMMVYISPIMIGIISLSMPAALPLYWTIGGLFMVIQTLISELPTTYHPCESLEVGASRLIVTFTS